MRILKRRTTKKKRVIGEPPMFDTVRRMALALDGVEEGMSYGTPGFRVNGQLFARLHQDGSSLVLKAEYAAREVLMGTHPESFYITDHYSAYPWVLVRLENVDRELLHELIKDAWRSVASKRAAKRVKDTKRSRSSGH